MINARRLSGENYGNGVSYRVAVCRQRLRASRAIPRTQSLGIDGQLVQTLGAAGHSLNSPGGPNELLFRQLIPRQTQLADDAGRALTDLAGEAGIEPGSVAQEKAEDT